MSKQASPALIGGFFIGAVALIVAGVFIFGSGKFFTDTLPFVLYFEGNVNGLQVGAPVRLQGVDVGSVTAIKATFKAENVQIRVPVFIEITQGRVEQSRALDEQSTSIETGVQTLVKKGMRAQLQLQSMVTGLLFVAFDMYPDADPEQVQLDPDTGLLELPTTPTTIQEVTKTVRAALEALGEMQVQELFQKLLASVEGIEGLVNSPEVRKTVQSLNGTLSDMQALIHNVDTQVGTVASELTTALADVRQVLRDDQNRVVSLAADFQDTLADVRQVLRDDQNQVVHVAADLGKTAAAANGALEHLEKVFTSFEGAVAPGTPLRYELAHTLEELAAAARAIRVLAQSLEQQPDAVIRGKVELRRTRGK